MHITESTSHDMIATLLEKVHVDSSDPIYADAQHLEHMVAVHMYTVYIRHH